MWVSKLDNWINADPKIGSSIIFQKEAMPIFTHALTNNTPLYDQNDHLPCSVDSMNSMLNTIPGAKQILDPLFHFWLRYVT